MKMKLVGRVSLVLIIFMCNQVLGQEDDDIDYDGLFYEEEATSMRSNDPETTTYRTTSQSTLTATMSRPQVMNLATVVANETEWDDPEVSFSLMISSMKLSS